MRGWRDGKIDRNLAPYNCRRNELSVQDGCVLWGARVVIPPHCRQEVLHELRLAHPGISRMNKESRTQLCLVARDLDEMVQKCDTCQVHNTSPLAAPLHHWQCLNKPFLGKMFLVAVDATSKWIETHIMNSTTSTAINCKLRDIFAQHGLPEILIPDNASNFTSEEFQTFLFRPSRGRKVLSTKHLLHTILSLMASQKGPYRL